MTKNFDLQPVLQNSLVILQPLQESDFEKLYKVASDPTIWEQHPAKERSQKDGFTNFFFDAIKSKSAFTIIDKKSNEVIGSTRYNFSIESQKAIEIGWTFLAKKYWGGVYNKSIKILMLSHAFKNFEIVMFYIDKNNLRSQKAVEKIGGQRIFSLEGKQLMIKPNASVMYAIKRNEFDRLKPILEETLSTI